MLERRIEQWQQSEEYPRLAFASGQGVIPLSERKTNNREQLTKDEYTKKYLVTELNDIVYNPANVKYGAIDRISVEEAWFHLFTLLLQRTKFLDLLKALLHLMISNKEL